MIGIYKITNKINNKSYIGQSVNIKRRWTEHKMLHKKRQGATLLKLAFKKYGIENFVFNVLEKCDKSELNEKEAYYITIYKPEYNQTAGGDGRLGYQVSNETRKKLVEAGKAQWQSMTQQEQEKQIANNLKRPLKGHFVTDETREKLRLANLGKTQTIETITKRIESRKAGGYVRPNGIGCKKIYCIELDIVFESVKQAAEYIGVSPGSVSAVLRKRQKTTKNYHFTYVV